MILHEVLYYLKPLTPKLECLPPPDCSGYGSLEEKIHRVEPPPSRTGALLKHGAEGWGEG